VGVKLKLSDLATYQRRNGKQRFIEKQSRK